MQALPDAASLPWSLRSAVVNPPVMAMASTLRQFLADVVSEPPAAAGRAGHRGAEISKTRAGERVSCSHTVLVLVFPFLILPLILPQILQNFSGTRDFVERHYFS